MTRDMVRYLLRSSRWYVATPVVLVALGYGFGAHLQRWRGDWGWGYASITQAVPVALFAVAFVVGWDAGARGSGFQAWQARLPDTAWKVPLSLLALPLCAVQLCYLGFVGAVAVVTLAHDGVIDPRYALVVSGHLAMMWLAASVGLLAGRLLQAAYACFTAAVVLGVLLFWSPGGGREVFGSFGAGFGLPGYTPAVDYHVPALATLATAALTLTVGSVALLTAGRLATVAVLSAGTLVVGSGVGSIDAVERLSQPPGRCAQTEPRVCVRPGYDPLLPVVTSRLEDFFDKAERRGVARDSFPHDYLHEAAPPGARGIGEVYLDHTVLETLRWDARSLALSVSTPLWCDEMFSHVAPEGLLDERQIVFDWAMWTQDALPAEEFFFRHEKLRGLDEAAISDRVELSLTRMRECSSS